VIGGGNSGVEAASLWRASSINLTLKSRAQLKADAIWSRILNAFRTRYPHYALYIRITGYCALVNGCAYVERRTGHRAPHRAFGRVSCRSGWCPQYPSGSRAASILNLSA